MSLQLGFMEVLTLLGGGIGAAWVLLQLALRQFESRLNLQFEGQSRRIAELEKSSEKIQAMELDAVKRDSTLALHYVLREEYRVDQVEIKQNLNQIFQLLREMSERR